jgi:hypothetical protein
MQQRFSARDIQYVYLSFRPDQDIQNAAEIFLRHILTSPCIDKTDWTGQVAARCYFHDGQAEMLLVPRAESAAMGAAGQVVASVVQGLPSRSDEAKRLEIVLRGTSYHDCRPSVFWTHLVQHHRAAVDHDLGGHDLPADRARGLRDAERSQACPLCLKDMS